MTIERRPSSKDSLMNSDVMASVLAGSTTHGGNNQALQCMPPISMPKGFAARWRTRAKNGSLNGELNPAKLRGESSGAFGRPDRFTIPEAAPFRIRWNCGYGRETKWVKKPNIIAAIF